MQIYNSAFRKQLLFTVSLCKLYITLFICAACAYASNMYTDHVNMFMGTDSSAQNSPAAIRPFGMISPGPFNNPHTPSGYLKRTKELIGFNHTRMQGTGCGAYGVLVLLPTTGNAELGTVVDVVGKNQKSQPGYYQAFIEKMNILAEMTSTKRAAIHRYTFPQSQSSRILIDVSQGIFWTRENPGEITGQIKEISSRALSGYVHSTAWAANTTYFYIEFNKPGVFTSKAKQGGYMSFETSEGDEILVRVGISYVSEENAKLNLSTELPHWNFDEVRQESLSEWESELAKIDVKGGTKDQQSIFYTSMYRLMFHPQTFTDVNHDYLGMDEKIKNTGGHVNYSVLSTWDTFRAAHPLYTLLNPDVQRDVIKTFIDDYNEIGWASRWKLANKDTKIMPGSWADVIIADAYIKGIIDFDIATAWDLVKKNGTEFGGRRDNFESYLELGYVPHSKYISVTKTLEHAYCDFTIAKFAEALGKNKEAKHFYQQSKNYSNLWDKNTNFFRGKYKNGNWSYSDNFDSLAYTGQGNIDYCEGNAWQWLWHVMHDTQGLINSMGGDHVFEQRLDDFFSLEGDGHHTTKGLGQYWHGNEPSQHAIYAYNYVGAPAKAAEKIRQVLNNEYQNNDWGISGNEDAGQLSAWYIFNAIGFYPYVHAVPEYVIGTPLFDKITINLPLNKKFIIEVDNNSAENIYVQNIHINGEEWNKTWLPHDVIMQGGTMKFFMGAQPSDWGTSIEARPYSMTPYIETQN